MAIYHLHIKNISRGDGRSAVAAAAYRAGETLPNEAEERQSAFGGRRDIIFTSIRLPDGTSDNFLDRANLWNAVERAEKRKDARLAKEIEFALPRELPAALWAAVATKFADAFVARGHIADFAVHDDGLAHNPHVHLMLTTRRVSGDRFWEKLREADSKAFLQEARALWARIANEALGKVGAGVAIDHRSHSKRAFEEPPGVHQGPDPQTRKRRREEARLRRLDVSDIERRSLEETAHTHFHHSHSVEEVHSKQPLAHANELQVDDCDDRVVPEGSERIEASPVSPHDVEKDAFLEIEVVTNENVGYPHVAEWRPLDEVTADRIDVCDGEAGAVGEQYLKIEPAILQRQTNNDWLYAIESRGGERSHEDNAAGRDKWWRDSDERPRTVLARDQER